MRGLKIVAATIALPALMVLQGCGVDGPPERPATAPKTEAQSSVSVSGYGTIGVTTGS